MKKSRSYGLCAYVMGVGIAASFTACMSGQNQATIDAIAGTPAVAEASPVVEAYIDYRGPQERWVGAAPFTLHVTAKNSEKPEVVVPPAWSQEAGATAEARRPAQVLTGEEARAKMAQLASALQEKDAGFAGCMYPIHVRLIRANGNVVDQQGCRGQSSWSKVASETVDFFMASK